MYTIIVYMGHNMVLSHSTYSLMPFSDEGLLNYFPRSLQLWFCKITCFSSFFSLYHAPTICCSVFWNHCYTTGRGSVVYIHIWNRFSSVLHTLLLLYFHAVYKLLSSKKEWRRRESVRTWYLQLIFFFFFFGVFQDGITQFRVILQTCWPCPEGLLTRA